MRSQSTAAVKPPIEAAGAALTNRAILCQGETMSTDDWYFLAFIILMLSGVVAVYWLIFGPSKGGR
jgi:hypothetical protein